MERYATPSVKRPHCFAIQKQIGKNRRGEVVRAETRHLGVTKTFLFAWAPPDPYETSAVLSQGGKELRAERLES